MAVCFDFTTGTAPLKSGLQSWNSPRQRNSGAVVSMTTRWGSLNSRRVVARAAEETGGNTKELTRAKRGSRPSSGCVFLLEVEIFNIQVLLNYNIQWSSCNIYSECSPALGFCSIVVTFPETSKDYAAEEFWDTNQEHRKRRWGDRRTAKAQTAARQVEEKLSLVSSCLTVFISEGFQFPEVDH